MRFFGLILCCGIVLSGGANSESGEGLVAYWSFDEAAGAAQYADAGPNALAVKNTAGTPKRGVYGQSVFFEHSHALAAPIGPALSALDAISFSVWVKPSRLQSYREIFRQESEHRTLFSFQASGTILSLGLCVEGYVECDAPVDPNVLMDGGWHHCAATFDGEYMRVYLDGGEVGSLHRPGALKAGGDVPGYIGSLAGQSEHYKGRLDDLRIYGRALGPEEVAEFHRAGRETLARFAEEDARRVAAVYAPGTDFAETLAGTRERMRGGMWDEDVADLAARKFYAEYETESRAFEAYTGTRVGTCAAEPAADYLSSVTARMLELLLEYRPLTEEQWARQTPEQRSHWAAMDTLAAKAGALQAGEGGGKEADWIRLALEIGPHIDFRPVQREAVAPYRTPETPETRDLGAEAARECIEADWRFQADHNPSPQRILDEIAWTRGLAGRIQDEAGLPGAFSAELADLAALKAKAEALAEPSEVLYFEVRALKRSIAFRNPVFDFDRVLFVDMPFPDGSEWPHETRHRLGYMAVPGGRLLTLEGLSPAGHLTQLMPQAPLHGSFWRPCLSCDASKVLFCFKPHNEKTFHLYEINIDGSGLTQLTSGPYDDLDPIYLPDGEHLLFSTTRSETYVRCMPPTDAFVLARCGRDGRGIYLVSRANEPDYLPSVLHDGRVIYTRWEYTDKPLWRAQSLWTMRPDGTQVNTLWGNQSVWPDLIKDARAIPGSSRIMFTGSAHHNWFAGSVGIIDPQRGLNFPEGLTKVTADVAWPESGNGPIDPIESPAYHASGAYSAYYSPYPLSERDFLVSANRNGKFLLYWMDVDGNRELIYEGTHHILHALPIRSQPRPPVLDDRVAWPTREERLNPQGGVLYSSNVYEGAPDVLQKKAKFLRVLSIEHKTYTYWAERPYLSTGPVVSGVQSEGVKRVLGTVPIEADGSFSFQAPSGIPLHFQLLDEEHRALQTMRSFTGVMPGERRGCLGCHERHSAAPPLERRAVAQASEPGPISPLPWGADSVSYARYVRPVLDRYCAECHEGEGKGRERLDLTPRPGFLGFDETYWLFTGKPAWGAPYAAPENPPPGFGIAGMLMVEGYDQRDPAAYKTPPPMTKLSYASPLVQLVSSGEHHGVRVDEESRLRLILWVDAMCPYLGTEEIRAIPDPEFQGIDWLARRPRIQNAPVVVRPGPLSTDR